jgi:hypothetical protein
MAKKDYTVEGAAAVITKMGGEVSLEHKTINLKGGLGLTGLSAVDFLINHHKWMIVS